MKVLPGDQNPPGDSLSTDTVTSPERSLDWDKPSEKPLGTYLHYSFFFFFVLTDRMILSLSTTQLINFTAELALLCITTVYKWSS